MLLTQEVALNNVGKYIDSHKRRFGYYPMQIILINKKAFLKDRAGVCMEVPEKEGFNCHYFDFMYADGDMERKEAIT